MGFSTARMQVKATPPPILTIISRKAMHRTPTRPPQASIKDRGRECILMPMVCHHINCLFIYLSPRIAQQQYHPSNSSSSSTSQGRSQPYPGQGWSAPSRPSWDPDYCSAPTPGLHQGAMTPEFRPWTQEERDRPIPADPMSGYVSPNPYSRDDPAPHTPDTPRWAHLPVNGFSLVQGNFDAVAYPTPPRTPPRTPPTQYGYR